MKFSLKSLAAVPLCALCVSAQDTPQKVPDAASGAFDMIAKTPWTPLSILALVIIIAGYLIYVRMTKLAEKSRELVAAQAEIEKKETEKRTMKRDAERDGMRSEYNKIGDKVDSLSRLFETHLLEHKDYTRTLDATMLELSARMLTIEKNSISPQRFERMEEKVNGVDKNVAVILSILHQVNPGVAGSLAKTQT
jgi:uncharacterized protein YxeA